MSDQQREQGPEGPERSGGEPPVRPGQVSIAAVLWIVGGVLAVLVALRQASTGTSLVDSLYYSPVTAGLPIILGAVGLVVVVLAARMRHGSDGARIAVTVAGAFLLLDFWTVLFVVPALVLQFQQPSNAWFSAIKASRFPPPPPPPAR